MLELINFCYVLFERMREWHKKLISRIVSPMRIFKCWLVWSVCTESKINKNLKRGCGGESLLWISEEAVYPHYCFSPLVHCPLCRLVVCAQAVGRRHWHPCLSSQGFPRQTSPRPVVSDAHTSYSRQQTWVKHCLCSLVIETHCKSATKGPKLTANGHHYFHFQCLKLMRT